MFGYVRPCIEKLSEQQRSDYKAVYCGLCRTMGRRHGFLARFSLNYDFTFLAMLLGSCTPEDAVCGRCPVHPLKKCRMCCGGRGMEAAADESLILTYHKLLDDVRDNSFFASIPARIACLMLRPAYKKAVQAQPQFDHEVTVCLEILQKLEQERSASMDRAADTFARILAAAAIPTDDAVRDRAFEQLLYHVGRWIYIVDAWDDLEKDRNSGTYNPLDARFDGRAEQFRDQIRTTLLHSRNLAASAYALAPVPEWNEPISNILYLGLQTVEELVFTGQWKQRQKTFRRMKQ